MTRKEAAACKWFLRKKLNHYRIVERSGGLTEYGQGGKAAIESCLRDFHLSKYGLPDKIPRPPKEQGKDSGNMLEPDEYPELLQWEIEALQQTGQDKEG